MRFGNDRIGRWTAVAVVLAVLGLTGAAGAAAAVVIDLKAAASVDAAHIRVGDVARVAADDPDRVRQVREVVLCRAPQPGYKRSIDGSLVSLRLAQLGLAADAVQVTGDERVQVTRRAQEIGPERLEAIVRDFLTDALPWPADRVSVGAVRATQRALLPTGPYTYMVSLAAGGRRVGRVPLTIDFRGSDGTPRQVWVTAEVSVMQEVLVAARPLERHHLLQEEDVVHQTRSLEHLPPNTVEALEEIVGMRVRQRIAAGDVLRAEHLELPPLVRRRDVVAIVAESDGLHISTLGEARQNGRRGERIRVVNLDSHQTIYARVIDERTVRVDF